MGTSNRKKSRSFEIILAIAQGSLIVGALMFIFDRKAQLGQVPSLRIFALFLALGAAAYAAALVLSRFSRAAAADDRAIEEPISSEDCDVLAKSTQASK